MPTRTQFALAILLSIFAPFVCPAQTMPQTQGQTLSGKSIVLSQVTAGRTVVLVAGFSRKGGNGCGPWARQLRADPAFAAVPVYPISMLEAAPRLLRGMIVNGMKKDVSLTDQDTFVVLVQDDSAWKQFFSVTSDDDPYVALIAANGQILWHGHGSPENLEPLVRAALPH